MRFTHFQQFKNLEKKSEVSPFNVAFLVTIRRLWIHFQAIAQLLIFRLFPTIEAYLWVIEECVIDSHEERLANSVGMYTQFIRELHKSHSTLTRYHGKNIAQ